MSNAPMSGNLINIPTAGGNIQLNTNTGQVSLTYQSSASGKTTDNYNIATVGNLDTTYTYYYQTSTGVINSAFGHLSFVNNGTGSTNIVTDLVGAEIAYTPINSEEGAAYSAAISTGVSDKGAVLATATMTLSLAGNTWEGNLTASSTTPNGPTYTNPTFNPQTTNPLDTGLVPAAFDPLVSRLIGNPNAFQVTGQEQAEFATPSYVPITNLTQATAVANDDSDGINYDDSYGFGSGSGSGTGSSGGTDSAKARSGGYAAAVAKSQGKLSGSNIAAISALDGKISPDAGHVSAAAFGNVIEAVVAWNHYPELLRHSKPRWRNHNWERRGSYQYKYQIRW